MRVETMEALMNHIRDLASVTAASITGADIKKESPFNIMSPSPATKLLKALREELMTEGRLVSDGKYGRYARYYLVRRK